MEAVVAKAHGLPEETALAAVTSDAASILGIGDRVGTLASGIGRGYRALGAAPHQHMDRNETGDRGW